ncbi:sister chromatid cohesion 1 protein 1 [Phtheirospermum japonicum]|uniref:Sister chromatid cohesion 1 protein 1 n=1 Tax=Phtheirospermum japonicum TaxID=374723 RepID=A0A830C3S0_9LAMI|nr:sister chromatid cohesion 1 protein 1 [Phtheirospermum japonicum]
MQQSDESKEPKPDQTRQRVARGRAKRSAAHAMDYEQTVIPGQIYQSLHQNSSDLVRGKQRKQTMDALSMMKISALMDLPFVALVEKLVKNGNGEIHYLTPLLEVWIRSTQPPHDSPFWSDLSASATGTIIIIISTRKNALYGANGRLSHPYLSLEFSDFDTRVDSLSMKISIEKHRANGNTNEMMPPEILIEELRNNLKNNGLVVNETNGASGLKPI